MKKKLLSAVLALSMVFTMAPIGLTYATESGTQAEADTTEPGVVPEQTGSGTEADTAVQGIASEQAESGTEADAAVQGIVPEQTENETETDTAEQRMNAVEPRTGSGQAENGLLDGSAEQGEPIGLSDDAALAGLADAAAASEQNASVTDNGTCGENLTWTLDSEGTLTISGSGEMDDYDSWDAVYVPWKEKRLSIQKVIIEKGVTGIGDSAFEGCSSLTSIDIPDGVISIGYGAFEGCGSLTNIDIPDGVTGIGNNAFLGCSSLTSINIPDSVTSIGYNAFGRCSSLTSINIPDGITSINGDTFNDCSSLTSISIPNGVTSIGYGAFWGCSSLTSIDIPDGVISIGYNAFRGCSSLTSIDIPDGITCIECYAFEDCSSLTSINIPDGLTIIEKKAFNGCSSLTSINIPDDVISIGDYAFNGCGNLTSINIPDGLTSIGNGAFSNCNSLTSIDIPDGLTSIGSYAFCDCSSLTSIDIPDGLTSIGSYAFYDCSSLTSIDIPDGVIHIGNSSFFCCSNLTNITLPKGITYIGGLAFAETGYYKAESNWEDGFLYYDEYLLGVKNDVSGECRVKEDTKAIDLDAFVRKSDLTKIIIPDGVEAIPSFWGCTNLKEVILPSSARTIEDFTDCENLEIVRIPEGVKYLDSSFSGCSSLAEIILPSSLEEIDCDFADTKFYQTESNWENGMLYCGNWLLSAKEDLTGTAQIKEGTIGIAGQAFGTPYGKGEGLDREASRISGVEFPDSLKYIGASAFYECEELVSIKIPESVEKIGSSAFGSCIALSNITLPDRAIELGQLVFWDTAYEHNDENWKDGILYIGSYLCHASSGLTGEVEVRDGTKYIGGGAFSSWNNITKVILPESVTYIGNEAFYDCSELVEINIPKHVTRIGDRAFYNCYKLKSLDVPDSVEEIGYDAFGFRSNGDLIDGFSLSGSFGSAAETYAKENGIPFTGREAEKEEISGSESTEGTETPSGDKPSDGTGNSSEDKPADINKELQEKIANTEKDAAVTAEIPANAIVSKDVIKAAKDKGVKLEIKSSSGTPAVWTFMEITNDTDFNPAVTAGVSIKPIEEKLARAALSNTFQYTQVRFAHEGVLPGKAVVTLNLSSIGKFTEGETVYLYYYNPDTALFEKVGSAVYTNGTAAFTMTHCSDYIVTNQELPAALTTANTSQAAPAPGTADVNAVIYYMLLLFGMAVTAAVGIRKKES